MIVLAAAFQKLTGVFALVQMARGAKCLFLPFFFASFFLSGQLVAGSEFVPFRIQLSSFAFSPNADGVQDGILIRLSDVVGALQRPLHWDCEIRDARGKRVRFWKADKRLRRARPSFRNFFFPSDKDIEAVKLFRQLYWDGRDGEGRVLPDAVYSLHIRVVEPRSGRIFSRSLMGIALDTEPPKVELEPVVSQLLLSAAREKNAGFLLRQKVRGLSGMGVFVGRVLDAKGRLLSQKTWRGRLPGRVQIQWKDLAWREDEAKVRYRYELVARDRAGNQALGEYSDLVLGRFRHALLIHGNSFAFSPNGDGIQDTLSLEIRAILPNGSLRRRFRSLRGQLQILPEKRDHVLFATSLSGTPPIRFRWNGQNRQGEILPDGKYFVRFLVNGQRLAADLPVFLDTKPPAVRLSFRNKNFVPDGDGRDDLLSFSLHYNTEEISNWKIGIYLSADANVDARHLAPYQSLYRFYSGRLPPESFWWDGTSQGGAPAESYEKFFFICEARDFAGNQSRISSGMLETGLLLRPIAPGEKKLLARIPMQNYFGAKGHLTAKGRELLESIHSALADYGLYRYAFEVHSSAPGREERNLQKTEREALSVDHFLKEKAWWPDHKYDTRGFGETELLYETDLPFSHYRNERIELRLLPE